MHFPRYKLFMYVDADALEITPHSATRFHQAGGGYLPALVRADVNLNPPDPEEWAREAWWPPENSPEFSFYRIDASALDFNFAQNLEMNDWY